MFWHSGSVRPETGGSRRLADRLAEAGIALDDDPVAVWCQLRTAEGRRATIIDLYELVAAPRGLAPDQLPLPERLALARSVMPIVWPGFAVTHGSARVGDTIEISDYDVRWPEQFQRWRGQLVDQLGDTAVLIEHIGSTSVPGLAAKAIVDIQISVGSLSDERLYVNRLERAGVQLRSRDEFHRYFRPPPGKPRDVHVHVCEAGSPWEREHLLFRDYLRKDPDARNAYGETKRVAAGVWADDGWGYTDAKAQIVLDILAEAKRWARSTGWTGPLPRERGALPLS